MSGTLVLGMTHPKEVLGALPPELLIPYIRCHDGGAVCVTFQFRKPKPSDVQNQWYADKDGAITLLPMNDLTADDFKLLLPFAATAVLCRNDTASILWVADVQLSDNPGGEPLEVPMGHASTSLGAEVLSEMQRVMEAFRPPWSSSSKRRRVNRVKADLEEALTSGPKRPRVNPVKADLDEALGATQGASSSSGPR